MSLNSTIPLPEVREDMPEAGGAIEHHAGTADSAAPNQSSPISKKAMKKAAKAERFAAMKLERRAREKYAKKEKKKILAEKRAAGELESEDEEMKRRAKKPKIDFGGKLIVDLGFDDMMSDKEITSLCSQLAYTYSANRRASYPFTLIFTSLNGRTYDRLETLSDASYKRWSNTFWYPQGYEELWLSHTGTSSPVEPLPSIIEARHSGGVDTSQDGHLSASTASKMGGDAPQIPKGNLVYLTADTEDELEELKSEDTYIIGGICDHNRFKNLCLNKARQCGIRTARLPIGRYLASLPTRKVLTVNQVFEILVKWIETKDWEDALYSVIPKRKFQQTEKEHPTDVIEAAAVEDIAEESP